MSISEILIKIGGVVLFLAGLFMILAAINLPFVFALSLGNPVLSFIVGVILMGMGIYIIRGGAFTV